MLYYYKILAIDTSFNASDFSNTVNQTAEPKLVEVTFEISVPEFTVGTVFVVGNHTTIGDWNPGAVSLAQADATTWTKTVEILDGTGLEFKFTRGSWDTVMKGADGNEELANLMLTVDYGTDGTQLYQYTVLNWRDPLVTSVQPLDGATEVPQETTVITYWSQSMASDACFSLAGPAGEVSGTCIYNDATKAIIFTPDTPLTPGSSYTATATGLIDAAGDVQQVPFTWSFTTAE
jgi:hypothetical protein